MNKVKNYTSVHLQSNQINVSEDVIFVTKDISCEFKCKLDERKCNLDQWWNNDICPCECKSHHICEKEYVWDTAL